MGILVIRFLVGIAIVLVTTQLLIRFAKKLSFSLKISPLVIGITLIAIGTSLPELSFSTVASIKGDVGLAMGNIVGSNIVNILMVLPVGILVGRVRVGTTKTQRSSWILLAVTLLFAALQLFSVSAMYAGLILVATASIVTFFEYQLAVDGRKKEDRKLFAKKTKITVTPIMFFLLIPLVVGIIVGSFLAVTSIEQIAIITGISTTILGLSLTAIVTSLPELATTIFSQEERQEKLTLGNIMGSNIYNLALIGGIINLLAGKNGILMRDWIYLIGVTLLFIYLLHKYSGKVIPRKFAFVLLLLLAFYLVSLTA